MAGQIRFVRPRALFGSWTVEKQQSLRKQPNKKKPDLLYIEQAYVDFFTFSFILFATIKPAMRLTTSSIAT
jgi:hypothetical protein